MGVDMSGLTVPQAQERWQQKGQAVCQTAQLPLTVDGETAGQVSLWELGVSVTPETAAQLAYDAGHSGHFLENGWSLLRSWFRETSLTRRGRRMTPPCRKKRRSWQSSWMWRPSMAPVGWSREKRTVFW